MSVQATMALLYAQTELAAPLAHSLAVAPQAAADTARTHSQEVAKHEQQLIAKTEPKKEGEKVHPDGKEGENAAMFLLFGNRRKNRHKKEEEEAEEEGPRPASSPLVGNLLNVKV